MVISDHFSWYEIPSRAEREPKGCTGYSQKVVKRARCSRGARASADRSGYLVNLFKNHTSINVRTIGFNQTHLSRLNTEIIGFVLQIFRRKIYLIINVHLDSRVLYGSASVEVCDVQLVIGITTSACCKIRMILHYTACRDRLSWFGAKVNACQFWKTLFTRTSWLEDKMYVCRFRFSPNAFNERSCEQFAG